MNTKSRVSVIIPTYKSDDTLIRAIDSVLGQTYDNFEVIVVDDNDPKSSYRQKTIVLMSKYKNNEKVKYILHPENRNGAAARNTAFKNSTGHYITFLDDDDYYYKDKLKVQVEYMESHQEKGGCYCWVDFRGKIIKGTYDGDLTKLLLSLTFSPTTPALMVRRECYIDLNGFDESYRRHQDFEFLLRFFKKYSIGHVPSLQVKIDNNGVNNTPKGQKLIDLKTNFFNQFSQTIESYKENDPKIYKLIYLKHYVPVFKDLLRYGYPFLALKIYVKFGFCQGGDFWRYFFKLCLAGQVERIKNMNR